LKAVRSDGEARQQIGHEQWLLNQLAHDCHDPRGNNAQGNIYYQALHRRED
jgi:hypothetical protein